MEKNTSQRKNASGKQILQNYEPIKGRGHALSCPEYSAPRVWGSQLHVHSGLTHGLNH